MRMTASPERQTATQPREKTRRYKGLRLTLSADMVQASANIWYHTGDHESWQITPYRVADVRHDWNEAFTRVRRWLGA